MRILVCAPYLPYPPRGGGRADIWRRIEAFTRLGHEVMLLHQYDAQGTLKPAPHTFSEMDGVLTARYSYPIRRDRRSTIRQLVGMGRLPWHAAKASPRGEDVARLREAVRSFRPDLVWLDGPWMGEIGRPIAQEYGVPLAYRSHNVEHLYLRRQAAASASFRNRIAWRLAAIGVKRYERQLMSAADRVFDISLDDREYWTRRGLAQIEWLPPLPELALENLCAPVVVSDLLFVGGLSLPNNVAGVRWLVDEVLPRVRSVRPRATLTIVGSSVGDVLRYDLSIDPAVITHYDVPSVSPFLFGARVLVNPVSIGSGVQLKMLDMLMTDAPIVTRSQGVRGLPTEFAAQCVVAESAESFAAAIVRVLDDASIDTAARERARRRFTLAAVADAISSFHGP